MKKVYCHPKVQKIYELHRTTIEAIGEKTTIIEQLTQFADNLFAAWQNKNPVCKAQINNWHPNFIGKDLDTIFQANFTMDDARVSIAKDCGFLDWAEVETRGSVTFNLSFERAVDTLLAGDLEDLQQQIERQPKLITMRSNYGHQATLLNYAGSNGVEMWRQKVPYNLPEIVQLLLDLGANKQATMRVYGGDFTTLELVKTSAHPYAAGIIQELESILN